MGVWDWGGAAGSYALSRAVRKPQSCRNIVMMLPRKAGKVMPQIYNPIHPLPSAFAQHIIDVEMQFEETHTLVLLNTLLSLYSVRLI